MIPKIIHLIWFGNKNVPEKFQKYIDTWKTKMPDYEIILWNEKTFDVEKVKFTKEAYCAKKWAFVSDYVRLYALYMYGGWYLDTDVEVIKSFNSLLNNRVILSTDTYGYIESAIIGAEKGHILFRNMIDFYNHISFFHLDGSYNQEVINTYIQNELKIFGYKKENKFQHLDAGIIIFPDDFFHVYNLLNGSIHRTDNTYAIHWHSLTWVSKKTLYIKLFRIKIIIPLLGEKKYIKIVAHLKKIWNKK